MIARQQIQYLPNRQIDKAKWNKCIEDADNGLIYGYSFYLDHMAKHWDALVMSNGLHSESEYEAVMPLTWNSKYGINYLYQPFLTAQLGIFGKKLSPGVIETFIQSIPSSFRLIDILLNHGNLTAVSNNNTMQRNNYVLDLRQPYASLFKNYRENIKRNVKKAVQNASIVQKDFTVEKVITLALEQMKGYVKESSENAERFRKLYAYLHKKKMATTYGVFSPQQNLLSSCVFFFSHNRAYYILVGNHPDGKTQGASHALIDAFIKDYAGKPMLLDFEGSDIRNLAFFYNSFGATVENYPALKINRLPFFLKWMKK